MFTPMSVIFLYMSTLHGTPPCFTSYLGIVSFYSIEQRTAFEPDQDLSYGNGAVPDWAVHQLGNFDTKSFRNFVLPSWRESKLIHNYNMYNCFFSFGYINMQTWIYELMIQAVPPMPMRRAYFYFWYIYMLVYICVYFLHVYIFVYFCVYVLLFMHIHLYDLHYTYMYICAHIIRIYVYVIIYR